MTESTAGEVRYLLSDGLGSVRQVLDENAGLVSYNEFDPYGNVVQAGEGVYGFTGEWWEGEVGLLHLRARWYLPGTGTFLSVDPVESEPPYLYVNGDPINFLDPSGYQSRRNNPCDSWSFPFKQDCIFMEGGDLITTELFYRAVNARNYAIGWFVAAEFFDNFLDATGEPLYVTDRDWLLSTPDDRKARQDLITEFARNYLRPVIESCQIPNHPITAEGLIETGINPSGLYELKNTFGEHFMKADFVAWLDKYDSSGAKTHVKFYGDDTYDFDSDKSIFPQGMPGIGQVPHRWLNNLRDAGRAAEFDMFFEWTEDLTIRNISQSSYQIRVDNYSVDIPNQGRSRLPDIPSGFDLVYFGPDSFP